MAVLTIRNIDDELKRRLRIAAAERGVSMEEHVSEASCDSRNLGPVLAATD